MEPSFTDIVKAIARLNIRYKSRDYKKYNTPSDSQATLKSASESISITNINMSLKAARPIPKSKVASKPQKRVQPNKPIKPSKPINIKKPATHLIYLFY